MLKSKESKLNSNNVLTVKNVDNQVDKKKVSSVFCSLIDETLEILNNQKKTNEKYKNMINLNKF
jgi:hypothetical protein